LGRLVGVAAVAVTGCGDGAGASSADMGRGGEGQGEGDAGGEGEGEGEGDAGGEGEGEGEGEAGVGEATPVGPGDPIDVHVETLVEGAVASVVAWPGGWLAEGPDGLRRFEGGGIEVLDEGPVGLSAAVPFGGGLLLASSDGLWFVGDGPPALSPLNESVAGALDLAVRGDELWIAGAQGVHRWEAGELVSVRLGEATTAGARLAVSGADVWVLWDGVPWRLWEEGEGWRARPALAPDAFEGRWMGAGPSGGVWVSDGSRILRVVGQEVQAYVLPDHAGLSAAVDDVWVWDSDALWRLSGESLWPVAGVGGVTRVVAQGSGSALVVGSGGLVRVGAGEPPPPPVPGWDTDVKPVFERACEMCHGARSNARRLETREAFAADIEAILTAVRAGRMPLPPNEPLTADDIDMLDRWRRADFPE